jgi:hypothetical protein
LAEIMRFEFLNTRPKYHLLQRQSIVGSFSSLEPLANLLLQQEVLTKNQAEANGAPTEPRFEVLRHYLTNHCLREPNASPDTVRIPTALALLELQTVEVPWETETRRLGEALDRLRYQFATLAVESAASASLQIPATTSPLALDVRQSSNQIELLFEMPTSGVMMLPIRFSSDWECWERGLPDRRIDCQQTAGMFVGFAAPAGFHSVVLKQTALIHRSYFWVSLAASAGAAGTLIFWRWRSRNRSKSSAASLQIRF